MSRGAYIYHPDEMKYRFTDDHPFNQERLALTTDLLETTKALQAEQIIPPRVASMEELLLVHHQAYIDAVQALSEVSPSEKWLKRAEKFGLHNGDTPHFTNMHEITSLIVGGSLQAADLVMSGSCDYALHLAGGLHHAHPHIASGFCIYNDASITIAYLRKHYNARILYIDTDVHHGDGVQFSFYQDADVCTFSIHETGKYLFPGTGNVDERGNDHGFGTTFNIPVEPYSEDDSWLECFEIPLRKIVAHFKPDIIVSQHGCDAHAYDPLAHIQCSMRIYQHMPGLIQELAETYCQGRWIALGGGGYDIWRVVPRAWSLLWMTMSNHPLLASLDAQPDLPLPDAWIRRWKSQSPVPLPATWLDDTDHWEAMPRRKQITEMNKKSLEISMLYLPSEP